MNSKKQLTISIVAVMALVLMIVGVSYAAFTFTGTGQRANTITTGVISMSFTESSNIISIDKALPTTDATGKTRLKDGEYFDFTLSSTIKGSTNVNWEIAAEDVTSTTAKKIDGKHIKLYLTKLNTDGTEEEVMSPKVYSTNSANNYTGRPAGMMSLAKGTTGDSFSTKYRLRMYVDETYNPQGDGGNLNFSVKINAYGKVTTEAMPTGGTLRAYMLPSDTEMPSVDFHTTEYKEKITSIVTKNDNTVPSTAIANYDVSEEQNKSVMAYLEDDETGAGTYKLTIGSKGKIIASESMRNYFYGFTNVKSMDLSNLDTSFTTNMNSMFINCSSLTELDISNFDISNVTTFGGSLLYGCNNLVSLNMSGWDFSKVTSGNVIIGVGNENLKVNLSGANFSGINTSGTFSGIAEIDLTNANFKNSDMHGVFRHTSIKKVDLSNANLTNANMNQMFVANTNLINVNLNNIETTGVTDMSFMFKECSNLTTVNLNNVKADEVVNMSSMFESCTSLINLDLSKFNSIKNNISYAIVGSSLATKSSVTNLSNMFKDCTNLINLNLKNFDTSSVTNMDYMFFKSGVTALDLSSFDTKNLTTMVQMFSYCNGLTNLDISNFDTSKVTEMSGLLLDSNNLTSVNLSGWDFSSLTDRSSMLSYSSSNKIKVNMSNTKFNGLSREIVSSIMTGIAELDLSNVNFTNIDMSRMFSGDSVSSINLSGAKFTNVNMREMFSGNSKLSNVNLTNVKTKGVTDISQMFVLCGLKSLDLSSFDTPDVTDMSSMFVGSSSLTEVNFGNFDTSSVTNMSSMFSGCRSLTSLDLSSFDTSKVTSMNQMFSYTPNLKNVTVGKKWVIDSSTDIEGMFGASGTDHVTVA